MLRWVIALLVVANIGFYAWSGGHLSGLGMLPQDQREPKRLQAQIHPETMRLLNAPNTTSEGAPSEPLPGPNGAPSPDPIAHPLPPTACWLIRGLTPEQMKPLRQRMQDLALPKGSWAFEEVRSGGRWVVYMGRYNDEQMLARKKEELRGLQLDFRTLTEPPLGPGLALGTYPNETAAEQGLKDLTRKGVRSARAAQERGESVSHTLRLNEITEQEHAAVVGLGSTLLAGKLPQACAD